MNTFALLRETALLLSMAGSLIQTILAHGDAGASFDASQIDENGKPTSSLRTIVHAIEVLNDFSKTQDFGSQAPSRAVHAYYVVERAVHGQHRGRGELQSDHAGEPEQRLDAGDLPSGPYGGPVDSGRLGPFESGRPS